MLLSPNRLPAIVPVLQFVGLLPGADRLEGFPGQLDAVEGEGITAAIVHIEPAVVVREKSRVPAPNVKRVDEWFPLISFWIGAHPQRELPGIGRTEYEQGVSDDADGGGTKFIISFIPGSEGFSGGEILVPHVRASPVFPLRGWV